MIWLTLITSTAILAGWVAAVVFLSEPLADLIYPLVVECWDSELGDEWHASFCIAAAIVALLAGLAGVGVWSIAAAVIP